MNAVGDQYPGLAGRAAVGVPADVAGTQVTF